MKHRPLEIEYFGGAGTVTGSSMLLTHQNKKGQDTRIMLDYGSFVGSNNEETMAKNCQPPIDSKGKLVIPSLDALVLSHAHQDHIGRVMKLEHEGFEGRIFTTPETAVIMQPMLRDAVKIANANLLTLNRTKLREALSNYLEKQDKVFRGRGRKDRGERKENPRTNNYTSSLVKEYKEEDIDKILELVHTVEYGNKTKLAKGTYYTPLNAGHILGSAMSLIEADAGDRIVRLLNTHDLGNELKDSYLGQPEITEAELDVLAIEGTYGDREHAEREPVLAEMLTKIVNTLKVGGKVIIPAFALERSQEILMFLSQNLHTIQDRVGFKAPIFLDSRLAQNVTNIYKFLLSRDDEKAEAKRDLSKLMASDCFSLLNNENRASVTQSDGAAIIVSSSGMCDAGPVREHLLHGLGNPKNLILFAGYPGTGKSLANAILNSSLANNNHLVRVNHQVVPVRAETFYARAFSSHAGQAQLVKFVDSVSFKGDNRADAKVLIQHCDPITGAALRERILNKITDLKEDNVQVAETGKVYRI